MHTCRLLDARALPLVRWKTDWLWITHVASRTRRFILSTIRIGITEVSEQYQKRWLVCTLTIENRVR